MGEAIRDMIQISKNIITCKLRQLKEYANNTKKHPTEQVDKIVNMIQRVGFRNPIIIDDKYEIIAGHGRLKAAKKLKMSEVPCIMIPGLSEDDKRAYRIADNKLAESEWDIEKLEYEFEQIKGYEFEELGFNFEEIKELTTETETEKGGLNTEAEEVPEEMIEVSAYERTKNSTKVKRGDLYKLGEHRLMCGDSTSEEDVKKLMGEDVSTLMVTDPPYGVNYDPEWRNETNLANGIKRPTRAVGKVMNDGRIDWSDAYKLFNGDVMYIYHAGKFASKVQESIEKIDFNIVSQIIWVNPHFILSRGDYHWKHEPCWYAVREGKKHNWQGSRNQTTVWEFAGMNCFGKSKSKEDEITGHGTQKPIACMMRPIMNNTKKDDIVYDPFGGSGTTLIAAEKIWRKCRMMELDPVYVQVILDRFQKYTGTVPEKVE